MSKDDLLEFARKRAAARTVHKGRVPGAMYRRFFPAAEVFRESGFSVAEIADEFVAGGKWPAEKADALRQAIYRHFRKLDRVEKERAV